MSDIYSLMVKTRDNASLVIKHHTSPGKKKASAALYSVLADCKMLCERCEQNTEDKAEVERLFAEQPKSGNRRYVEKGSDVYVLICRFVFTETDRTNAMRYASALRVAGDLQVRSDDLAGWMKHNGGVNALYFRRPLDARQVKTKALRLAEQITFSRDAPFTLTLQWQPDNTFAVL